MSAVEDRESSVLAAPSLSSRESRRNQVQQLIDGAGPWSPAQRIRAGPGRTAPGDVRVASTRPATRPPGPACSAMARQFEARPGRPPVGLVVQLGRGEPVSDTSPRPGRPEPSEQNGRGPSRQRPRERWPDPPGPMAANTSAAPAASPATQHLLGRLPSRLAHARPHRPERPSSVTKSSTWLGRQATTVDPSTGCPL